MTNAGGWQKQYSSLDRNSCCSVCCCSAPTTLGRPLPFDSSSWPLSIRLFALASAIVARTPVQNSKAGHGDGCNFSCHHPLFMQVVAASQQMRRILTRLGGTACNDKQPARSPAEGFRVWLNRHDFSLAMLTFVSVSLVVTMH